MEVSITKISQNGQIVIPSEIRRDAKINPSTKFIVFNQGGNIMLKQIRKDDLNKDFDLIQKISNSEKQIKKGKYVKASSKMKDADIDKLLMG